MADVFRIHGDNVVECERIVNIIIGFLSPHAVREFMDSPSVIVYEIDFNPDGAERTWRMELLPGFNKANRSRWSGNVLQVLKSQGSILDETPDAVITRVDGNVETILFATEFCSALQAGNQAWQRSGRAYSTGRTGCPYLYIVDFVKYELESSTRVRKNLRFPNPAVPYSYISYSLTTGNFVAQVYLRSEEFNGNDPALRSFNVDDFAERELAAYIVKKMAGFDTSGEEREILRKNFNVVLFLSRGLKAAFNISRRQWEEMYLKGLDFMSYSLDNIMFSFKKKITEKRIMGIPGK